jgi:hypothetical protein
MGQPIGVAMLYYVAVARKVGTESPEVNPERRQVWALGIRKPATDSVLSWVLIRNERVSTAKTRWVIDGALQVGWIQRGVQAATSPDGWPAAFFSRRMKRPLLESHRDRSRRSRAWGWLALGTKRPLAGPWAMMRVHGQRRLPSRILTGCGSRRVGGWRASPEHIIAALGLGQARKRQVTRH